MPPLQLKLKTVNIKEVSGFEWDAGNKQKSLVKHEVSNEE